MHITIRCTGELRGQRLVNDATFDGIFPSVLTQIILNNVI
jgi:hypothetical protein